MGERRGALRVGKDAEGRKRNLNHKGNGDNGGEKEALGFGSGTDS
jgi:hypothetical protein